jgi:RNA polymerase sigma-70 factor (ECF subfamily)
VNKSKSTDEELVLGCIKNNKKSQEILYKKYFGKLCAVAHRYVGREFCKDIAQDSFVKFFNNVKIHKGGNVEGWLRRITANTALDHLRADSRMSFVRAGDEDENEILDNLIVEHNLIDYKIDPDEEKEYFRVLKYKISEKELLDMISSLSTCYKTAFNLYVFEGLDLNEIATYLGNSPQTIKSNLYRARLQLMEKLESRIEKRVIT